MIETQIASVGVADGTVECRERVERAHRASPRAVVGRLGEISDGALALLAARGLTHVVAELGGPTEIAHAFTLPQAPTLAAILAAARAARAHGLSVIVETPLTRSTSPSLVDVARLASALPASAFAIRLPVALAAPYPSLPLAVTHARAALDHARRAGVFPLLVDAPRCLAGAFAPVTVRETERSSVPACLVCAARASCAGVDDFAVGVALPGMSTDLAIAERARTFGQLLAAVHATRESA